METSVLGGPRLALGTERNDEADATTAARAQVAEPGVVNRDISADDFDFLVALRAKLKVAVGNGVVFYPRVAVVGEVGERAFYRRLHFPDDTAKGER